MRRSFYAVDPAWRSGDPEIRSCDVIAENFAVFAFELSPDDMASIATLDMKTSSFFDHRDPAVVKRLSEALRDT